jgi:hypothetical protein
VRLRKTKENAVSMVVATVEIQTSAYLFFLGVKEIMYILGSEVLKP